MMMPIGCVEMVLSCPIAGCGKLFSGSGYRRGSNGGGWVSGRVYVRRLLGQHLEVVHLRYGREKSLLLDEAEAGAIR